MSALSICTESNFSKGTPPCRGLPSGQADPVAPRARAKAECRYELTDLGTHHHQGRLGWQCSPQSVRCRRHRHSGPAAPPGLPGKQDGGKNGKQNKTRTKKTPQYNQRSKHHPWSTPIDRKHLGSITGTQASLSWWQNESLSPVQQEGLPQPEMPFRGKRILMLAKDSISPLS